MTNIVFDFRHAYTRGSRLEADAPVYQWDTGRIIEAYVPEEEPSFAFHVGREADSTLTIVSDVTVEPATDGGVVLTGDVPDELLAMPGRLLVFVVATNDGMTATIYEGAVDVKLRAAGEV